MNDDELGRMFKLVWQSGSPIQRISIRRNLDSIFENEGKVQEIIDALEEKP